jgi:uncharacterized membrane protein YcaP (DUF421 family)
MEPKPIHLTDWHRILAGSTPWPFLVEVLIRAGFPYLLLMLAMRLLGKRVAGQMSISELAIILTLGAAIGLPIQVPDKGLLPAVVVLGVALSFQRGLSFWAFKSRKVEVISQGDVSTLLKDGRLLPDGLRAALLSPEKIFASLRTQGVEHLGQVRRVYLEPTGG